MDHLTSKNVSSENFKFCGKLRESVRNTRGKYEIFLDDQRRKKMNNEKGLKWNSIQEEIVIVKAEKSMLEKAVVFLLQGAD